MDKPKTTAKDFFLWFGAMLAFYWSITASIFLIFDYINYLLPNTLNYYPTDPYQSGISYEMASIIVLLPLFVYLMRVINRDIVKDPSRKEIWVRRWAIILTLFVAGVAIAIDLITLLTTFLNGEELTLAFLLKVLLVLILAAKVFLYFIADLKGYWERHPARRRWLMVAALVAAAVVIVAGFFIVGTPQQARAARFDAQRVTDLQTIQSQVTTYYQAKQKLPITLADLNNSLSYCPLPVDPQTATSYIYKAYQLSDGDASGKTFHLCATFNAQSRIYGNSPAYTAPVPAGAQGMMADNWSHGAGQQCFNRTIDPSFYPPLK
jgi:hypothetical protein